MPLQVKLFQQLQCSLNAYLPFGWDVFLFLCKRPKAVISEESFPMAPHEVLNALTPPASISVADAFKHKGPANRIHRNTDTDAEKSDH